MDFVQIFDCPHLETFRNLDARQVLADLLLKLSGTNTSSRAVVILASSAVIVGVVEEQRVCHLHNGRLTLWTNIAAAMSELETAVAAHELVFVFSGYHGAAIAATDEAREGKFEMCLGARVPFTPKKRLHPVVFRFGDHGLVFSFVPSAALPGIFKAAIIEWLGEDLINRTPAEGLAAHLTGGPCAKSPLLIGEVAN